MAASRLGFRIARLAGLCLVCLPVHAAAQAPDLSQVLERAGQFVSSLESGASPLADGSDGVAPSPADGAKNEETQP